MLFQLFKCPKCESSGFSPSFEDTIESYISNEYNIVPSLLIESMDPPKKPEYVVFKCSNKDCNHTAKLKEEEIIQYNIEVWARVAWMYKKAQMKSTFQFEEFMTKYLYDEDLKKFITSEDLDKNAMLRDFFNIKESE